MSDPVSLNFCQLTADLVSLYPSCLHGLRAWWAQVDSNHRPRAYQARALTC